MNKAYEQLQNAEILREYIARIKSWIKSDGYFDDNYIRLFNKIDEVMDDIEDFLNVINEEVEPTIEELMRKI